MVELNMTRLKSIIKYLLSAGLIVAPALAQARLAIPNPAPGVLPEYASDPVAFIFAIINILLTVAGLLAVLFIIIGGFQYITSGANGELAESAKKTIQNAVIGLIVIILSFVIVRVINTA